MTQKNPLLKDIQLLEKELDRVRDKIGNLTTDVKVLQSIAQQLEKDINNLSGSVVTKDRYAQTEKLVYAVVVAVIIAVIGKIMGKL